MGVKPIGLGEHNPARPTNVHDTLNGQAPGKRMSSYRSCEADVNLGLEVILDNSEGKSANAGVSQTGFPVKPPSHYSRPSF